jgi:phosphate transport system substrate-binding protein
MRTTRLMPALAASAALAFGVAACGSNDTGSSTSGKSDGSNSTSSSSGSKSSAPATLNGAGSTFAAPVYQQWGSELKNQGITLNYQGVGSGAGVAALQSGTVQWAGSDPALTPDDTSKLTKGDPLQVPMFFGAITISYNLDGVKGGLKLDGATVADIFAKKITKWNDPAIAKMNPGVSLPAKNITVVHRSDSSGTTKGFTQFLANYSSNWKDKFGVDKDIKWPSGETGAKGNDGVAASIKQTAGAVGYVEQAYALQNDFTFADVKNKSGGFIAPTLDSTSAAGEGLDVPADLGISTIDSANPKAYPIVSQTFIDTYKDPCKAGVSAADAAGLKKFISYGLTEGQSVAKQLMYATLPSAIQSKAQSAVDSMTCNGAPIGS